MTEAVGYGILALAALGAWVIIDKFGEYVADFIEWRRERREDGHDGD